MRDPSGATVQLQCRGCKRDVLVPAGPVNAARRRGILYVTFCSPRCQRRTVAIEGARQQALKEKQHAERPDPGAD